jgi:hypothetical protein
MAIPQRAGAVMACSCCLPFGLCAPASKEPVASSVPATGQGMTTRSSFERALSLPEVSIALTTK